MIASARRVGLEQIIARAQAGDTGAFGEIYRRFAGPVHTKLSWVVGTDLADDITQQTFERLLDSGLARFRPHRGATFDAWLYRVAHNLAIDSIRYAARRPNESIDHGSEVPAPAPPDPETIPSLIRAVAELGEIPRTVVVLHQLRGWPLMEIATLLDKEPQDVYLIHSRARRRLQRTLRASGFRAAA